MGVVKRKRKRYRLDKQEVDLSRICSEDANHFTWNGYSISWEQTGCNGCIWYANGNERWYNKFSAKHKKEKDLYKLCQRILDDNRKPV